MQKLSVFILAKILSYSDNCNEINVSKSFLNALAKPVDFHDNAKTLSTRAINLIKVIRYVIITRKFKIYDLFTRLMDVNLDNYIIVPQSRGIGLQNAIRPATYYQYSSIVETLRKQNIKFNEEIVIPDDIYTPNETIIEAYLDHNLLNVELDNVTKDSQVTDLLTLCSIIKIKNVDTFTEYYDGLNLSAKSNHLKQLGKCDSVDMKFLPKMDKKDIETKRKPITSASIRKNDYTNEIISTYINEMLDCDVITEQDIANHNLTGLLSKENYKDDNEVSKIINSNYSKLFLSTVRGNGTTVIESETDDLHEYMVSEALQEDYEFDESKVEIEEQKKE